MARVGFAEAKVGFAVAKPGEEKDRKSFSGQELTMV